MPVSTSPQPAISFMPSSYPAAYAGNYAPPEARWRIVCDGLIVMGVGGTPLTQLAVTSRRDVAVRALEMVAEQLPGATLYELTETDRVG